MNWFRTKTVRANSTNNTEKRIAIILIAIFLFPALAFSVFELSQLNKNEEIIQEIYKDQLDAILFSINQYSNDILDQWTKVFNGFPDSDAPEDFLLKFLEFNPTISQITFFTVDTSLTTTNTLTYSVIESELIVQEKLKNDFLKLNNEKKVTLLKLAEFIKNDYQKIEALETVSDSLLPMTFALKNPFNGYQFCAFMVDPQLFVEEVLAPKIQEVARDEFIITSYCDNPSQQLYATDSIKSDEIVSNRKLWLLPNHFLGISLKGNSIDKIVKARTRQNILILLVIDGVLIVGLWLVFRNMKKELLLAQLKSEFVSNVSHEIRTPLAMISIFAETLFEGRISEENKKKSYYKMINDEADRLNRTVNKILNFSRIESGKKRFRFEAIDLQKIAESSLNEYKPQLQLNNFNFQFKTQDSFPLVLADKEAIAEVFNNLIDNAIKYSLNKKEIILKSYTKSNYAILSVQDFGIGIPEKFQKDIFNKFYRVPNNDIHDTKGTGLGLTLVKHIVDAHKGKIILKSTENMGSTFLLYFPITN
ncbi:sensor histidine kinase [Chondrinema litorale]|uniref:sensor histidine kinase n=1 Tax=Chondrinema litorale TaxID=2994555 RepID=UPI002542A30C|nr:HAMP domain-containing sensor histidine kinase [Chondrinema litorale]UZR93278.1 HAMP domain-containing sensor histidine kinase [Chondrinema litorale]